MASMIAGGLSVAVANPRRSSRIPMMSLPATRGANSVDCVETTSNFFNNDSRAIMLYDAVCNLCNGGVKFVRDNDRNRLIASDVGCDPTLLTKQAQLHVTGKAKAHYESIKGLTAQVAKHEALQSEAGKQLLMRSGRAPDDISSVVLVEKERFIRDFAYDNIANNRYNIFGKSDSCKLYVD